jgi:hypothetical protein
MPNPIIRLGWALFGRWMQVRFVRRCQRRMVRLVADRLAGRDSGDGDAPHGALRVLPAATDPRASARITHASRSEPSATTGG